MFSVTIVIIPVFLSSDITVLKPGLFLILISFFLTPLSISSSFAIFRTISSASLRFKSSAKLSRRASMICSPLKPCSDFSRINAS